MCLTSANIGNRKRFMVTNLRGDYPKIFINPVVEPYGKELEDGTHEHVIIHAINLKDERFIVCSEEGYYSGREALGRRFARVVQAAYKTIPIT